MSERAFVVVFEDEHAIVEATRAAREAGLVIHDVYTPYAVHGLDEAMGLKRSRLTWVCFAAGVTGLAAGVGLQLFASVTSWPLNVGGKPNNSMPAFLPVAFEVTVLFAALITVFALFVRARLYPKLRARAIERVTDDRFALALATRGEGYDETSARSIAKTFHAVACDYEEVPS